MTETLWEWLFGLIQVFADIGSFLTTPLEIEILGQHISFFGFTPLTIFGVIGLTTIISVHIVKLFV